MQRKNIFFFIIDALRFDAVECEDLRRALMPTYHRLSSAGVIAKVTTNAQVTKFVMPSIFTQSYPLDFGGYNDGIKHRPKSFVEVFKENGYSTIMLEGHDIDGPHGCFERGFDTVRVYHDKRLALEGILKKKLLYEIKRWRKGAITDDEIITLIQREYGSLLSYMEQNTSRVRDRSWRRTLGRFSTGELRRIQKEITLLERDPMAVINKIELVAPFFYFGYLGKWPIGISIKFRNKFFSIGKSLQKKFNRLLGTEISFIPSRPRVPPVASALLKDVLIEIGKVEKPWFSYVHIMDPHDYMIVNRPLYFLNKLSFLPQVLRARAIERDAIGENPRRIGYDLSLAYVDYNFGKFVRSLEKLGEFNDTVFCLIGDHGEGWDRARDASLRKEFGYRTHYEHLTIPLMISPVAATFTQLGMADSMSISATMLDRAGLPAHEAFKGKSIFGPGRSYVVSENCGRGNADIERRDIYFTVTGPVQKLMARLTGEQLVIERLYDTKADPKELVNCLADASAKSYQNMIAALFEERKELFDLRNVKTGSFVIGL